jgi:hypothetical protein
MFYHPDTTKWINFVNSFPQLDGFIFKARKKKAGNWLFGNTSPNLPRPSSEL